jgi:hypothetical protein
MYMKMGAVRQDCPAGALVLASRGHSASVGACCKCTMESPREYGRQCFGNYAALARRPARFDKSHEEYLRQSDAVRDDNDLKASPDPNYGLKCSIPLLQVPEFDVMHDVPVDAMHTISGCTNHIKKLLLGQHNVTVAERSRSRHNPDVDVKHLSAARRRTIDAADAAKRERRRACAAENQALLPFKLHDDDLRVINRRWEGIVAQDCTRYAISTYKFYSCKLTRTYTCT